MASKAMRSCELMASNSPVARAATEKCGSRLRELEQYKVTDRRALIGCTLPEHMLGIVLGLLLIGFALSAPLTGILARVGARVGAGFALLHQDVAGVDAHVAQLGEELHGAEARILSGWHHDGTVSCWSPVPCALHRITATA